MYVLFGIMWLLSSVALVIGNTDEKPQSMFAAVIVFTVTTVCVTVLTLHGFK